jgi:hypothetical protein
LEVIAEKTTSAASATPSVTVFDARVAGAGHVGHELVAGGEGVPPDGRDLDRPGVPVDGPVEEALTTGVEECVSHGGSCRIYTVV